VFESSKLGFGFLQSFEFAKISIFSGGSFSSLAFLKNWCLSFSRIISSLALSGSKNRLQGFQPKFWQAKVFIGQSRFFSQASFFGKVRFLKSASRFSVRVLANWVWAFLPGSFFLAMVLVCKVSFQHRFWQVLGFGVFPNWLCFCWQSQACKKLWCV
jgi:hypothetical protein